MGFPEYLTPPHPVPINRLPRTQADRVYYTPYHTVYYQVTHRCWAAQLLSSLAGDTGLRAQWENGDNKSLTWPADQGWYFIYRNLVLRRQICIFATKKSRRKLTRRRKKEKNRNIIKNMNSEERKCLLEEKKQNYFVFQYIKCYLWYSKRFR